METAKTLAHEYDISRIETDAFAARSHLRAAAWADGRFDAEVAPLTVLQRKGEAGVFSRDKGARPDTTPESLACWACS